jgi:hypothetical protein
MVISSLQGASFCVITQFCHSSGTGCIAGGLLFGLVIVLPGYAFDAKKTLEAIIKERYS